MNIQNTEGNGRVPNSSEPFYRPPNTSEEVGDFPNIADRNVSTRQHSESGGTLPQHSEASRNIPQSSESSGSIRQHSEDGGNIPQRSEGLGTIPTISDEFRRPPHPRARTEQHTLTVREVARMFEAAGVPRTERSITNWCVPNRHEVARLDAFYEPNERRYFITPQSANSAIQEELAKVTSTSAPATELKQPLSPSRDEMRNGSEAPTVGDSKFRERIMELEGANRDLEILNRVKDHAIERLEKEQLRFADERNGYVDRMIGLSREVGELSSQVLGLTAPSEQTVDRPERDVKEVPFRLPSNATSPNPGKDAFQAE